MDKIIGYCKNRRDFLRITAIIAVMGAIASQLWIVLQYLLSPNSRKTRGKLKIGEPEKFNTGITFVEEAKTFILRDGNRFRALSAICTHLGCTLRKAKVVYETPSGEISVTEFHCPCHGSKFNVSGERISGPAEKPLQYLQITLSRNDNQLVVDNSIPVDSNYSLEIL
jgi:cytochrome b6-f complex iron-sulfur subunit